MELAAAAVEQLVAERGDLVGLATRRRHLDVGEDLAERGVESGKRGLVDRLLEHDVHGLDEALLARHRQADEARGHLDQVVGRYLVDDVAHVALQRL